MRDARKGALLVELKLSAWGFLAFLVGFAWVGMSAPSVTSITGEWSPYAWTFLLVGLGCALYFMYAVGYTAGESHARGELVVEDKSMKNPDNWIGG